MRRMLRMIKSELLTTGQVAEMCGVHRTTVNYWIISGKLPVAHEINGIRLIEKADVDRFAAQRKTKAAS